MGLARFTARFLDQLRPRLRLPAKKELDNYRSINALADSFNGLYKAEPTPMPR
jgi:hypothetical protein